MKKIFFGALALTIFAEGCSEKILGNDKSSDERVKEETKTTFVSFRIDDIDFSQKQEIVLRNAVLLARKYNIVFDLGVIAGRFETNKNAAVFRIYEENSDIFEIVAHGLTHLNPVSPTRTGEFYDATKEESIPEDIQESHIREMKEIFKKHGLREAQEIFFVPWHAGDRKTIEIAERNGYRLITMSPLPDGSRELKLGNIFATSVFLDIVYWKRSFTGEEIQHYCQSFNLLLAGDYKSIEIVMHPYNFATPESSDELIGKLMDEVAKGSLIGRKIKFGFVSQSL